MALDTKPDPNENPEIAWLLEDFDDTERMAEIEEREAFYARLEHHGNWATDPVTGRSFPTGNWGA